MLEIRQIPLDDANQSARARHRHTQGNVLGNILRLPSHVTTELSRPLLLAPVLLSPKNILLLVAHVSKAQITPQNFTVMVRHLEEEFTRFSDGGFSPDVEMIDLNRSSEEPAQSNPQNFDGIDGEHHSQSRPVPSIEELSEDSRFPRYVIAIDFGTTFSSVAFTRVDNSKQAQIFGARSIRCIDHYPGPMPSGVPAAIFETYTTVPTELLFETSKAKRPAEDAHQDESSGYESDVSMDGIWNTAGYDEPAQEQETSPPEPKKPAVGDSIWGWGVHANLAKAESISQTLKHLKNFKLLLDESDDAIELREESKRDLKKLKAVRVVDVIADYLAQLLKHTKERLTECHGLREDSAVEFVLCVPTSWSDKACRVMQDALTAAVHASRITRLDDGVIKDLFIVAESEAAATYALDHHECASQMTALQSFMVLDCGGGTVDAVTYTLTQADPPRLREVVPPKGTSCGSSFLNKGFKKLLEERLKGVPLVGADSPSKREKVIDESVQDFEYLKRSIDIVDKRTKINPIFVRGLQRDERRGHTTNHLELDRKAMYDVFKYCLKGVQELMLDQLNAAKNEGVNVRTVILIGGFGESPSLKKHLEITLKNERNLYKQSIGLVRPNYVGSAVARGAVLRALRKKSGPKRYTRSSYGVLRTDLYNELDPKHRRFTVYRDRVDGETYVGKTIKWVIDQGSLLSTKHEEPVRAMHLFKKDDEKFLCEEILYVSSKKHESGYKVKHPVNKGAEELGRITIDLTELKDDPDFKPETWRNAEGKKISCYRIVYDLWIIIEGRTLKFEARSPWDSAQVTSSKKFSIAAGFVPGTQ